MARVQDALSEPSRGGRKPLRNESDRRLQAEEPPCLTRRKLIAAEIEARLRLRHKLQRKVLTTPS